MPGEVRISQAEARWKKLPSFFTGKRCRRGHLSPRRTTDGSCRACIRLSPSHERRKLKRAIEQGKVFSVARCLVFLPSTAITRQEMSMLGQEQTKRIVDPVE